MANLPPLSLYIHIPWCVQKCPYCDFNSHALKGEVPHDDYVQHLLNDLQADAQYAQGREIGTIFIGGGTVVPWGLIPVAAICNVDPVELARKNMLPVFIGLTCTFLTACLVL